MGDLLQVAVEQAAPVPEAMRMVTVVTSLAVVDQVHTLHYQGELAVVAVDQGDAVIRVSRPV
jgi:hypothetical protein